MSNPRRDALGDPLLYRVRSVHLRPRCGHISGLTVLILLTLLVGATVAMFYAPWIQGDGWQTARIAMLWEFMLPVRARLIQQPVGAWYVQPERVRQTALPAGGSAITASLSGSAGAIPILAGRTGAAVARPSGRRGPWAVSALPENPLDLTEYVTTSAGVEMPRVLYTTVAQSLGTAEHVATALSVGFRGFQTGAHPADYYEPGVGAAIARSGVKREELFIQTSVHPGHAAELHPSESIEKQVERSIAQSLENLKLDYVDALVLDRPYPKFEQTLAAWQAMETAVNAGLVKQLGVTNNMTVMELRRLYGEVKVKPAVLKERFNVEQALNTGLQKWADEYGVHIQSFREINTEPNPTLVNEKLQSLAQKYSVTASMLFFRFLMGQGIVPLTATFSKEHLKEDLEIWKIPLSKIDTEKISGILQTAKLRSVADMEIEEECPIDQPGVSGKVTNITGISEFLSAQRCNSDRIVICKFYAPWCRACKMTGKKIAKLAEEFPDMRFFEVDFEANREMCKSLGIKVLPYVEVYQGEQGKIDGMSCGPSKVPVLKDKLLNFSKYIADVAIA